MEKQKEEKCLVCKKEIKEILFADLVHKSTIYKYRYKHHGCKIITPSN